MIAAILFVFGTALGSFLNVVALRYNPERGVFSPKSIGGRSHCPSCKRELRWFELIPLVSFIIQGARCRRCSFRMPFRYFAVELVCGSMLTASYLFLTHFYSFRFAAGLFGWEYFLLALWALALFALILIVLIDLDHFLIPDELNIAVGVFGLGIAAILATHTSELPFASWSFTKQYALLATPNVSVVINRIIAGLAGAAWFWVLYAVSRGRGMGFGDVKLAAAIGLLIGWPDIALSGTLAFIVGGLWGAGVVLLGRGKFRDRVPFAPFFVAGTLITIFFGNALLDWYFSIFRV